LLVFVLFAGIVGRLITLIILEVQLPNVARPRVGANARPLDAGHLGNGTSTAHKFRPGAFQSGGVEDEFLIAGLEKLDLDHRRERSPWSGNQAERASDEYDIS
jgi:hypothetical protein